VVTIPFEGSLFFLRTPLFLLSIVINQVGNHPNGPLLDGDLGFELTHTVHGVGHQTQCLRETARTSPTCRQCQSPSHQIPDHHQPSTQPVLNVRPSPGYDIVEGTRTEADAPLRHGGLDQGSVKGGHKVFGTSIRSVPNDECNAGDSRGMTDTGGRGGHTWQVHCEFFESF